MSESDYYSVFYWGELIYYGHTNWTTLELAVQEAEKLALYLNLKGHGFLARKDMKWTRKNKEIIRVEKQNFYHHGIDADPLDITRLPKDWTRGIEKLYEPGGSMFIQSQENIKVLTKV